MQEAEHTSRIPGFYDLSAEQRLAVVRTFAALGDSDTEALRGDGGLNLARAEQMIENVVGVFGLPLGVATNFGINGRDYLVPMAIEEPSVVAGASYAARLVREGGGFAAGSDAPVMIGQIQVLDVADPWLARSRLLAARERILELANAQDPVLTGLGGGAREVEARVFEASPVGPMLIVHLLYDVRDAMGANAVNTAAEALAPLIEETTGGRVNLRILSNLADHRLARAWGRIPLEALAHEGFAGEQVGRGIVEAWAMAAADPYRAATHNKGIMNGIDAVVIATGNDWRAIEAGAHAYAARSGRYTTLSHWSLAGDGYLTGSLELPLAVGMVGGATKVHPAARAALKLLGVTSARELAQVIAAVGLAQNLAALRALAAEGIQHGHMALHARQVAMAAGATGALVARVAEQMVREGTVRLDRAEAILGVMREA
ncbi:MAG TPA: hydroxymethylglutaryl-CoA reductase, degradative [Anaerolineae bacterium]|nr:hydroxymethylglutaryl-CoA reductase, degradative [Anaerolineae bacterium]